MQINRGDVLRAKRKGRGWNGRILNRGNLFADLEAIQRYAGRLSKFLRRAITKPCRGGRVRVSIFWMGCASKYLVRQKSLACLFFLPCSIEVQVILKIREFDGEW